jgi:uncharacterized phosphosugar-binding protein
MDMNNDIEAYASAVGALLKDIAQEEPVIRKAAKVIADAIARGSMVHIMGTGGHSNMGVEEVLWRAGGIAAWNPILDPGTNLIHGAKRSNFIERTPGYAIGVMNAYSVGAKPGEVMIIINAYGINAMTIDTVLECKKRGVFTIAVTSESYCNVVPLGAKSRHPSGKNLYQEADLYINNHLPYGDAVMDVEGCPTAMGTTSTFCNCFVMNSLEIEIAKALSGMGITPPVFMSANLPEGDAFNKALEAKYGPIVKHLL